MLRVRVNGAERELAPGTTLAALVGSDPQGLAVARNREVVPRRDWQATQLVEGDELELVRAIQGG